VCSSSYHHSKFMSRMSDFDDCPFSLPQNWGKHMDFLKFFFTTEERILVLFAFWSVKKVCTLRAKRDFQEWKYRQLPFQGILCFDSVITVSPATRCCFHWFSSPNFSRPTNSSCRLPFSEGKHFLWFRCQAKFLTCEISDFTPVGMHSVIFYIPNTLTKPDY